MYADMLYHFVLSLTKSPSESKDLLQETFLRVWQNRENTSVTMSFKAYLYTIAKNLIIDSLRKKADHIYFDFYVRNEFDFRQENNVESSMNLDDLTEKIEAAKKQLTARQREVFELNKEKGFSIEQIAAQLKTSKKTVKNHLSLGMRIIREELKPYYLTVLYYIHTLL